MKNNYLIFIFIILIFTISAKAELIFENEFPKDIQGIWSVDCEAGLQVHVIGNNSSLWIDEDYVGLNISKTSNVQNWTAYKWGEIDGSYYYFLKTNTQNQLMELTPPDEWDGIDYSFLNSNDFSIYEKCESIPSVYQVIYGEIVSLMNSKLVETCNDDTNPQDCITEAFNFLDVSTMLVIGVKARRDRSQITNTAVIIANIPITVMDLIICLAIFVIGGSISNKFD